MIHPDPDNAPKRDGFQPPEMWTVPHFNGFTQDRHLDPADAFMLRQSMRDCLRGLPRVHRLVCLLCYADELTGREIAAVLGVTESRVSQLHKEALQLLRIGLNLQPEAINQ